MTSVLLDTVVASLLHLKKQKSTLRALYEPHLQGRILSISFQTVAELYQWAEQNRWSASSLAGLDQFIAQFVEIPYERELARAWARIINHSRTIGRRLDSADGWIAATALRHGLPLITRDKDLADLKFPGLVVICHAA
jgi:tRNA(fMet)-specific endonuclease VapC